MRTLQKAGHVAYFAGGCVRDELLGRHKPKDYDIATDARPEQVRALFHRTRSVGEHFGVVLVDIGRASYEVATFRTEWGYTDHRRPDQVMFSDAEHDARRRDFTINGLFKDPLRNEIIDYVGGREDLARGVIRAIGDPNARLGEDHLRALRAVRFAARFGFAIEAATSAAIVAHALELRGVSRERIGNEVRLMITQAGRSHAIDLLEAHTLDLPALEAPTSVRSQSTGHLEADAEPVLRGLPAEKGVQSATALAAWMIDRRRAGEGESIRPQAEAAAEDDHAKGPRHAVPVVAAHPLPADGGGTRMAPGPWSPTIRRLQKALVLSNDELHLLTFILQMREVVRGSWTTLPVARQKRLAAEPHFDQLLQVLKAEDAKFAATVRGRVRELATTPGGIAPAPLLTGDDLIAHGLRPSPEFRRLLEAVYDAQLENRIHDRSEAIRLVDALRE